MGDFVERAEAGCPSVCGNFSAFCREGRAEDIRRGFDACAGESAGLAGIGDAEKWQAATVESAGGFLQTVAVGAGFDHGHDLLARELAGNGEIVKEGAQVDFGPGAWW